jgi:ubiquinone/menaquinone biosynthesis C-methylase UbiE
LVTSPYSDRTTAHLYRVVAGPVQFAPPASDLVAILAPAAGMRILDVGTGTGIVAERMRHATGPNALIVGVDAALTMLAEGRQAFDYPVVVARTPELPFAAGTFDLVVAGFVISHLLDHEAALRDIARVCRGGARIGVTAWGARPNAAAQLWTEVATRFVPRVELDRAFRAHIPWDEWFSDPTTLQRALEAAGLRHSRTETRIYIMRMGASDFLASRAASVQGTVLRERLSNEQWDLFTQQLSDAFEARFGRRRYPRATFEAPTPQDRQQ